MKNESYLGLFIILVVFILLCFATIGKINSRVGNNFNQLYDEITTQRNNFTGQINDLQLQVDKLSNSQIDQVPKLSLPVIKIINSTKVINNTFYVIKPIINESTTKPKSNNITLSCQQLKNQLKYNLGYENIDYICINN